MLPILPSTRCRCPHCGVTVKFEAAIGSCSQAGPYDFAVGKYSVFAAQVHKPGIVGPVFDGLAVNLAYARCPACSKACVSFQSGAEWKLLVPRVPFRREVPEDVPADLASDFIEACEVLGDSPKSSAALSRRCLQRLLVHQGAKKKDLIDQMEEIAERLPAYLSPWIDNVRSLGNISAHARRSVSTGEIVDVEHGEAEWMLELLEELFDHFYRRPAEAKVKHAALAKKIGDSKPLRPGT